MGLRRVRRVARLPYKPRIYTRYNDLAITRNRRPRFFELGEDIHEARAWPPELYPQATLIERIVGKWLDDNIGHVNYTFQHGIDGGRNQIGGFDIDFIVHLKWPGIAIEPQGSHWHRPEHEAQDLRRQLTLESLGYEYHEVWDYDVLHSDERLSEIMWGILERYVVIPYVETLRALDNQ